MDKVYISFYLRANRIHVFVSALREIGSPGRICFLMDNDGDSLILSPYKKRDFRSHRVPKEIYQGNRSLEISSMKLCRLVARIHHWDSSKSYRIPGKPNKELNTVLFRLSEAVIISSNDPVN